MRIERHCDNAMAVAKHLENHDKVNWVIYPGLASQPTHELAKKYLNQFHSQDTLKYQDLATTISSVADMGWQCQYEGGLSL